MQTPTYLLVDVHAKVKELGRKAFTSTAIGTGQSELGMMVQEMVDFICSRTDTQCYKTMPAHNVPGAIDAGRLSMALPEQSDGIRESVTRAG